jgi:hypothetical protein
MASDTESRSLTRENTLDRDYLGNIAETKRRFKPFRITMLVGYLGLKTSEPILPRTGSVLMQSG